jgi:hypothetical protein
MQQLTKVLLVLSLAFFTTPLYAEMAKEGSGDYEMGKSGTTKFLKLGEGKGQLNWDENGVIVSAPKNSPFEFASYRLIGSSHVIGKTYKGKGGGVFTRPNGDQIFGVVDVEGDYGANKPTGGTITIIGGTGECAGIEGLFEIGPRPTIKTSMEGIYQGVGFGKVSWKIP